MNDEQINEFRPVVHGIANRIAGRLPQHVDVDDLYSVGFIGLCEAEERFDASKGVAFKTFASHRINGAILDHLRELDWVPRSTRTKGKSLAAAQASASQKNGFRAEDEDVAAELGLDLPDYFDLVADTDNRSFDSLDQAIGDEDAGSFAEVIGDDVQTAEDRLSDLESVGLALGVLTDQERLVIERYWLNGEKAKDIGTDLGLTEGRVSQIRSKALKKMQERLAA
jgi:RNA polymerase sigma factor for flagellar operon FliA